MDLSDLPATDRATATNAHTPALAPRVEDSLRRSGYLALRDVACVASGGVISLHGRLPSYFLKQVAQEIAAGVEGVDHICNAIDVVAHAGRAPVGRDQARGLADASL